MTIDSAHAGTCPNVFDAELPSIAYDDIVSPGPSVTVYRHPWSAAGGPTMSTLTLGVSPKMSIAVRGRPWALDGEFSMSCDIIVTPPSASEVRRLRPHR
jgi:hypothetical protein